MIVGVSHVSTPIKKEKLEYVPSVNIYQASIVQGPVAEPPDSGKTVIILEKPSIDIFKN